MTTPSPLPLPIPGDGKLAAVTVLCGDCRELIATLPDGLVRMVLTDPPYGMAYRTNRTAEKGPEILGDTDRSEAYELIRSALERADDKLAADAFLYVFADRRLRELMLDEGMPFWFTDEIIWAKPVGSGDTTNSRYRSSYERVLVFRKGQPKLAGHPGDLIWADRPGKETKLHPAQKALFGLAEMIQHATAPGDVILDPFAGSGSTAAAMCVLLAQADWRKVILMERDPELCETIVRRLSPYTTVARELPK